MPESDTPEGERPEPAAHGRRPRTGGDPPRASSRGARRRPHRVLKAFAACGLLVLLGASVYVIHLEHVVASHFSGRLWRIPARVYGRPLELHAGRHLSPDRLFRELELLGYEARDTTGVPGTFVSHEDTVVLTARGFRFGDGLEPARTLAVRFDGDRLASVRDTSGASVPLARLDPALIGSLLPESFEDRIVVERDGVPDLLVDALIAVEDRRFYTHGGIDVRGVARAFLANLRAGSIVQGGSTLTQQLIRSKFLTNRRSLRRKLDEAVMALALERRFDKETIFEAYLNEVYMGQDGRRAVHGFGLASYFYFDKPLAELAPNEIALLVGMVKGPTAYDPHRHPEAARARRRVVLDVLVERGVLDPQVAEAAAGRPLVRAHTRANAGGYHPAFLDAVRRDLASDYDDEALSSDGLRILTTMDPVVQEDTADAVTSGLDALARARATADLLEGAAVVTSVHGGEILAIVGGRKQRAQGFNRALEAQRAVGSVLKPAVYLTALETGRYTLSSTVEDTLLEVQMPGGTTWAPRNFDETFTGTVPLCRALMLSRNVPTVRLGLELGVDQVIDTLHRLGTTRELPSYPSLFLGAVPLSPLDVAQLYNSLAAGGFVTPLRAVREVLTSDGEPLQRYPLELRQACTPKSVYQIARTLEATTEQGTARALQDLLPEALHVAGKTGTTDDFRDSWFAGFSGDRVAVVWVGRDDNAPTGLTGATGALPIWATIMTRVSERSFEPREPAGIEEVWIDLASGKRTGSRCANAVRLPFVEGRAPREKAPCEGENIAEKAVGWFRDIFR